MATKEANSEVSSVNKSSEMWPEIKRAFESKRFELNLTGPEISQRIETNNGALDEAVYKLKHLNFLEVARTKLSSLSSNVANIQNLTSLLCHSNELTMVPNELGKLEHLKNLDLSNNRITNLPQDLKNLRELFTLNLNGNQLDSLFPLSELKKLSVLDIGRNKFKHLPDDLGSAELENLSQIDASYNEISELSDGLSDLPALKTLNLENNQLANIPPALCKCKKLKDLLIKENKLKDNRLKKLVDQDKTKAIFEYLEKAYVEQSKNKPKSEASKTNKSKQSQLQSFQQEYDLIKVFHFNEKGLTSLELVMDDSIEKLRPYIVCVILRGLDLESEGNYKKFLNIQNKIHDDTCQKRTIATIATHDLKQINTKLFYEAADPNSIQLVPLGRKNSISAAEFYEKLMEEAENERKAKKRNQLSGIYKYLTLLTDQNYFTFIRDASDVISLPPLTNAEKTRISPETRDVLVEITSTVNMESCKKVIMELLVEFINSGIVSKHDIIENDTKSEECLSGGKQENQMEGNEMNNGKLRYTMNVQQVKIVDTKGSLKSVFPSRVDLDFGNSSKIRVIRTYDEDKK